MADEEETQEVEEASQEEEAPVEENTATDVPEEHTSEEPEEQAAESEEIQETKGEPVKAEPEKGFVRRYWMLCLGVLLALIGIAGVISLRLNYAQVYIMGDSNPYTGIGSAEPMGHGVSIVPFVIGVLMVVYWGLKTPPLPEEAGTVDAGESAEAVEPEAEAVETAVAEPEEFGHEHLPPHHLSPVDKIEHLTKVYAQGKMSEGLYKENLARFEEELDEQKARAAEAKKAPAKHATAPAQGKKSEPSGKQSAYQELKSLKPEVATNEEDHLPPHHLSPEEKIEHLTKSYGQGKVSRPFFEKNLKKFEVELKREKEYLPPAELHPRQKLEQLEDAFKMGVISKSTYDKNKKVFEEEAENTKDEIPELEFKSEVAEANSLDDDLDSLLKTVNENEEKKPSGPKKKTLMEELEDLEDL